MAFVYIYPPQSVSVATPPIQYELNGADVTVTQSTTASNNKALPSLNFIVKDGVQIPVTKDTGTPSNTVGIPVEIVAASGTPINITAGDINVQLTDLGVNFDSVRLGDGTGNYVKANSNGSIDANILGTVTVSGALTDAQLRATPVDVKTTDTGANASAFKLGDGLGGFARFDANNNLAVIPDVDQGPGIADTSTTRVVIATDQTAVPVSGPLTDAELRATPVPVSGPLTDAELRASAVPVSAASLPLPSGASTLAEQQAQSTLIGAVNETAPATDTASSGLNGRLQRIAQRLTSLIALLPTSLGQKASSASLATVLSTEQEAILTAIRDGVRASTPNGSTQSNSTVGTTAANVAIPANTVGFLIQGFTGNAGLYWSLGGTAANDGTSGHKLEDSRDSGFIPYAGTGNLSVIGEAASTRYQITWFTRS